MPSEEKIDSDKRPRGRHFPSASLNKALELATVLYSHSRRNAISRDVAAEYLGYTNARSGSSNVALALPAYYGLLEEAGRGKVRVTATTEGILHPKHDLERYELIKEAGARPKAFKEIIDRYKVTDVHSVPSDATLKPVLIREWQLSEAMALKFLKSFRDTMLFVQSSTPSGGGTPYKHPDHPSEAKDSITDTPREQASKRQDKAPEREDEQTGEHIAAPLSERTRIDIRINGPMGPKEIARLQKWVQGVFMPWAIYLQEDGDMLGSGEE